jgi:hypothetical protein
MSAYGLPGALNLVGSDASRGVLSVNHGALTWNGQALVVPTMQTSIQMGGAALGDLAKDFDNLPSATAENATDAYIADFGVRGYPAGTGIAMDLTVSVHDPKAGGGNPYTGTVYLVAKAIFVDALGELYELGYGSAQVPITSSVPYSIDSELNMHLCWISPSGVKLPVPPQETSNYAVTVSIYHSSSGTLTTQLSMMKTSITTFIPTVSGVVDMGILWENAN